MVVRGVSSIIQEYIEFLKSGWVNLVAIAFNKTGVVFSLVSREIGDELLFWTAELTPIVNAYDGGLVATHCGTYSASFPGSHFQITGIVHG